MKLDGLNRWLTLVANFGVVAGLIFLGVEIRQNTTALQAAAIQESTNVARQQILTLATDGELTRLTMENYDELDPADQRRLFWLDRSFWLGMQGQYRQWQLGVLPEQEWSVWNRIICANYAPLRDSRIASGGSRLWAGNRMTLLPEFTAFVERDCTAPEELGVATPLPPP
jgi:hypothetical protein